MGITKREVFCVTSNVVCKHRCYLGINCTD